MALSVYESLYVVFSLLSVLSNALLLFLFWRMPALRIEPGTLILGQSICQLILDLHWFTMFEEKDTKLCQASGAIGLLTFIAAYNYAVAIGAMMVFEQDLFVLMMRQSAKYHTISWAIALIVTVVAGATGCTGTSSMGTCFIMHNTNAEVIMLIILIIHTPLSLMLCCYAVAKSNYGSKTIGPSFVTLVFSATWLGSCVMHFVSWKEIHGTVPFGFAQFSKLTGSLSGFLTAAARMLPIFIRKDPHATPLDTRELI